LGAVRKGVTIAAGNRENSIVNPLDSIPGTIGAGVVLAVVLAFVAKAIAGV